MLSPTEGAGLSLPPMLLHAMSYRYVSYWYSRMISFHQEDRKDTAWLIPFTKPLELVSESD